MPLTDFPQAVKRFEIEAYQKPRSVKKLRNTHVPFSGSPQKHPYLPDRVILLADPYSSNTMYYEFNAKDISFVEELPSLVNMDGEAVTMVRVWVKKMSIGLRSTPFIVEDTFGSINIP